MGSFYCQHEHFLRALCAHPQYLLWELHEPYCPVAKQEQLLPPHRHEMCWRNSDERLTSSRCTTEHCKCPDGFLSLVSHPPLAMLPRWVLLQQLWNSLESFTSKALQAPDSSGLGPTPSCSVTYLSLDCSRSWPLPMYVVLGYPEISFRCAFLWLLVDSSCIVGVANSFLLHRAIIYLGMSKTMLI